VLGGNSWVQGRLLHVPDADLGAVAAACSPTVTPEQWRAVEAVQTQLVTSGIEAKE